MESSFFSNKYVLLALIVAIAAILVGFYFWVYLPGAPLRAYQERSQALGSVHQNPEAQQLSPADRQHMLDSLSK